MNSVKIVKRNIIRFRKGSAERVADDVIVEDPVEIYVNGRMSFFCMRLPGMERELVTGILYSEGVISSLGDILNLELFPGAARVEVKNAPGSDGVRVITSSSGGLRTAEVPQLPRMNDGLFSSDDLFRVRDDFLHRQEVFDVTGGTHAAALYNTELENIAFAEDIGRHNALDKCIGSVVINGKLGETFLVMLSSRMSFEMVRKSLKTGAAVVAGVSAPTSYTVDIAVESGLTLIGFLREGRFNVYSKPDRITGIPL